MLELQQVTLLWFQIWEVSFCVRFTQDYLFIFLEIDLSSRCMSSFIELQTFVPSLLHCSFILLVDWLICLHSSVTVVKRSMSVLTPVVLLLLKMFAAQILYVCLISRLIYLSKRVVSATTKMSALVVIDSRTVKSNLLLFHEE